MTLALTSVSEATVGLLDRLLAHRPLENVSIRLWDGTLARIAVHDHHDGVCDLSADAVLTATAPAVSSPIW